MNAEVDQPGSPGLLHLVSRSLFWNTALLPLVAGAGVLLSILVRRRFGLESGRYDVALGIANSILFYSALGLAGTLPKFVPEVQASLGRQATARLVMQLGSIRLAVVVGILVLLNVWANTFAELLELGPNGVVYLRMLSLVALGRAILDFAYRTLDSLFQQVHVNVLSLVHGVLDLCLVALVIAIGLQTAAVVGALGTSAVILAIVAVLQVVRHVRQLPSGPTAPIPADSPALRDVTASRVWKLSGVTYLRDLSLYFATPAFASPALATILGGPEPVAIFATSYFVAFSTVTLVVSGFRGIYRPAFAQVIGAGQQAQLQRAFDLVNKIQILAVVPAGIGLAVMVADYLPLVYGEPFVAAVPVARILVVLLFAETAFAVGLVVLWVDERYRPVLAANAVIIAGAPLFIWAAGRFGIIAAAMVLGGSRLLASIIGHLAARRAYGVRYPWQFAGKVTLASGIMAAVLVALRQRWPTSLVEAATLTILGVLIVVVGLRLLRVLGAEDIQVLERASIPGKHLLVRWLAG